MKNEKPYIDHEFAGVSPFTTSLEKVGITYEIVENDSIQKLFETKSAILEPDRDTIVLGKCTKEGQDLFFAEFGIKITASFASYVVFIYDHQPGLDELEVTADDIEDVILKKLDGVDIGDIMKKVPS